MIRVRLMTAALLLLAAPVLAQGPPPEFRKMMAQMQYRRQLRAQIRAIEEIDRDPATALSPAQAGLPWRCATGGPPDYRLNVASSPVSAPSNPASRIPGPAVRPAVRSPQRSCFERTAPREMNRQTGRERPPHGQ